VKYQMKFIFGLFFLFNLSVSWASIDFYYNLPPNDNPYDLGPRPNLIREIDQAEKRIEASFYQIGDPKIVDAFVRAAERGVEVRITTDTDWYEKTTEALYPEAKEKFAKAGILVVDDKRRALSHNKYCIIDRGTDRARVWMGSTNITPQGSQSNANASFLFVDPNVAQIFYADFAQMISGNFQGQKGGVFQVKGLDGETYLTVVGDKKGTRSGMDPKDFEGIEGEISYPKETIDGVDVEFYFSPRHNIQKQVVEAIYSAKKSIHFASFSLENKMVYQAIMNKAESLDNDYAAYPVALRNEPWEDDSEKFLRVANSDGVTFDDKNIGKLDWGKLFPLFGGQENEGKFYAAASYFYAPGALGGQLKKVPVHGIFNRFGSSKGAYPEMLKQGMPVRLAALRGDFHHKFMIIDQEILILGSYNFSFSAENVNDESLIIIRDKEIVEAFYEHVFYELYRTAYPEYIPSNAELEEFGYVRRPVAISEIQLNSTNNMAGRYVELYNYAKCKKQEECDALTVDLTGWKLYNGNIPWHPNDKISGTYDDLISFYNRPLTNAYQLNHPTEAHFLKPDLQTLRPGEFGLVVSRDFNPEWLEPYVEEHRKQFRDIYGRNPKHFYEKYPKLFIAGEDNDSVVGNGLKAYNFITLYYPDKYTIADRFEFNDAFRDPTQPQTGIWKFFQEGGSYDLNLGRGQSLERIKLDIGVLQSEYSPYKVEHLIDEWVEYYYGIEYFNTPKDWLPNPEQSETPGFSRLLE